MAKGIIFSISTFIIGSLILVLAILIFKNIQGIEQISTETNLINRAYELESALSSSIKVLFKNNAGITIEIVNKTISFTESLPNNNATDFKNNLTSFKLFIESKNKLANLEMGRIDNLPLDIKPYNITYTRDSLTSNTIKIKSSEQKTPYTSIDITLKTVTALGIIKWETITPGSTQVVITVKNDTNTITDQKNLNLDSDNKIQIEKQSITQYEITANKSLITITNKDTKVINVKTELNLEKSIEAIAYPGIIHINFPEFDLYNLADARIIN